MSEPVTHHSIFHYLNPIVWIRALFSYLGTLFLCFNRFFAVFFGCFVIIFIVLFFYDRYSNFTYGDGKDVSSNFKVGLFRDSKKYASPLIQNNRDLSKKINAFYVSKIQHQETTKPEQNTKDSSKKQKQTNKNAQNPRADLNPNAAQNQIAAKSYQEQWAPRPYKSIQSEVRRRTGRKK